MVPLHRVFHSVSHGGTLERAEEGPDNLITSPRLGRSKKKRNVEGFYTLLILQEQQQKSPRHSQRVYADDFLKGEGKRKGLIILSNKWKTRQVGHK